MQSFNIPLPSSYVWVTQKWGPAFYCSNNCYHQKRILRLAASKTWPAYLQKGCQDLKVQKSKYVQETQENCSAQDARLDRCRAVSWESRQSSYHCLVLTECIADFVSSSKAQKGASRFCHQAVKSCFPQRHTCRSETFTLMLQVARLSKSTKVEGLPNDLSHQEEKSLSQVRLRDAASVKPSGKG